jgi:Zn-dependent M28 family amino/carboxypeptidase
MAAPALALLLAACATAPTPPPTAQPTSNASPLASPPAISAAAIAAHVRALDQIAAANGGVRAVGTAGYAASVEYVRSELEAMGYVVSVPTLEMTVFRELPGATVEIEGGMSFQAGQDFRAMIYSAGGDVEGSLVAVGYGYDDPRGAGGCRVADWKEFPQGAIALVPPASCYRRQLVMHAQAAGAAAIIANDGSGRRSALRPTLQAPDITIPALASTWPMAVALHNAAMAEADVHIRLEVMTEQAAVASVVAETSAGDPSRVAMLGAHLDSVHDGPGINDNGSGVGAVLEIARAMVGGVEGGGRVRFALWAAEEYGLLGSNAYVANLADEDRQSITAYLNLDMLGSRNGFPFVYTFPEAESSSKAITYFLVGAFDAAGMEAELTDVGAASDHNAFREARIPVGGIFSGASEGKSREQAALFGGTAGLAMDACYHLACDTVSNVNVEEVAIYAETAAEAVLAIARGDLLP